MKILLSIAFCLVGILSIAQTRISGKVLDEKGQPIPGANVTLKDTYDGASSSGDGVFQFLTDEKGEKILVATFVGFKTIEQRVTLTGAPVVLELTLSEEINELQAVTISAGSFTASDESRRTIFRPIDVATTAGATADIAGALNTLPGTQKVGESGRLFVRGGDGNETRTFIDGLVVLDAYSPTASNTPSRGRFLPFMFKGTSFSTGGYSAEYGQALSSALILTSRDKVDTKRTDIGLMSVGADVAHTEVWDRASATAKVQYTNLRPYTGLISQRIDWIVAPASIEGSGAFRLNVGKDAMLKVYQNFNRSDFSLYHHDIADESIKTRFDQVNTYNYTNVSWLDALGENTSIRGGLSYTLNRNENEIGGLFQLEQERGVHVKAVIEHSFSKHVELKTGVEHFWRNYQYDLSGSVFSQNQFTENLTSAFVESDILFSNNFVLRTGLRTEYSSLPGKMGIDPRASLAYKLGREGQVSLAYGKFRQTAKNQYVRYVADLQSEKADHYIVSYQIVNNSRTFRGEAYLKQYKDLVKYSSLIPGSITNAGNGYAKGFELFWRDNRSIPNVDYWVSYSFLDTERDYLNYPSRAVPTFASKHNLSIVYKHFISSLKSQAGFTWSYTSGRPYHNPNESGFNQSKTPSYQDLSFNWSYLYKPWVIVYFSCTNLLGRDNVFGYEYASQPNGDGLYTGRAIRQPASRFAFLGIFITLSKDKSVTQLPTL
jgi:hypothetical protein